MLGMVPNAQKHLEVADLYEKLSADENASLQTRLVFARKANWHRILARMSAEKEPPVAKEKASDGEQTLRSETLFSPSRLWEARDKTELAQAALGFRALELLDALVGSVRPAVSRKQIKQRLLLRQGGLALLVRFWTFSLPVDRSRGR